LSHRADALDSRWRAFKSACFEGQVGGGLDREWFSLWEPRALQGAVSPGCAMELAAIRRLADDFRAEVASAGEAARRADVYPGTRRDTLRRYRLEYSGWDR
jgi:hypothetical protein